MIFFSKNNLAVRLIKIFGLLIIMALVCSIIFKFQFFNSITIEDLKFFSEYYENETQTLNNYHLYLIVTTSFLSLLNYVFFIIFIIWMRNSYRNLRLAQENMIYTENWTIWLWIFPILNLIRPYQLIKEMYIKVNYRIYEDNNEESINYKLKILLTWWILLLIYQTFLFISGEMIFDYYFYENVLPGLQLGIASDVVGIIALTLSIQVVQNYYNLEQELMRKLLAESQKSIYN